MKRPKTIGNKKRIWFGIASIFLLVIAFALSTSSSSMAATGRFDRDSYLPSYGDTNDFDRAWISVTDSSGNVSSSPDTITVTIKAGSNLTSFILKETGGTTSVFTSSGGTQSVTYPVGSTSGYVEDFNSGSHNFPALGASVVGLNLKELTANTGGDASTGTDGNLTVATGNTLELLYGGSTLDTAVVRTNSGSFTFTPSAVSAITTDSSVSSNLILSITDADENLNPVARDVIGFADRSVLLSGNPGTGSSRVQIEAIDQTTGSTLSLGGTSIIARNIMLVETGNNTGIFIASGKVFGTSTTVSSSDLKGNVLVGSSSPSTYTGTSITLGHTTTGPAVTFKIIEVNASGRIGLYEAGTATTGPVQPVLGFVSPASGSFVGTSSLSLSKVVAMGTTTSLFGVPSSVANQGTSSSGLLKLIDGSNYCLVAIENFRGTATGQTIGSTYEVGNGGSVTVSLGSFQLAGPRSGDTLKVSYLDELNNGGTSGTVTGTAAYGVLGETGTLASDGTAPDINDFVTITVVDGNLNTSTSTKESVAATSSLWGGTTTNNRGDRLRVTSYSQSSKAISVSHPDGFAVGTQTVRISNTDNSLVWMVPSSLTGTFRSPLSVGSTTFSLGTETVSTVPLVRGSSSTANSFLSSATTASFVATLDGLDNTVEISPDGTRWITVPIVETGANSATFVGTIGFDDTRVRLTTNTSTSITSLITDSTGTSTLIFQDSDTVGDISTFIGTGSVLRIFDGTTQEFAEVCSSAATNLSITKLSNSTAFDPDKTWVQVIGNDMMPERLDTVSGTSLFRIGAICGGTYRIRYNDALGASNVYMGGDTLAITTSNMGFTTHAASLSTNVTGSSGPDTFIVVTLVDQDLNTATGSKQSTFEKNDATGSQIFFNEDGLGLPSGSSTGNVSRAFRNGGTAKIVYASTLSSIRSASVNLSSGGNTIDFPLVETANDSGTFKGSFQLSSGTSTSNSSNLLKVSHGDSVRVFYVDSPNGSCGSEDIAANPIAIVTALGTLSLSKDTAYLSGDTVVVTVVDTDRNTNASAQDTLTTALKLTGVNYSVGTDLTMNLVENGVNTGTFLATITTGTTTSGGGTGANSGTIKTIQGGIANVIYTDTSPQASSATVQLNFSASDATLEFGADSYGLDSFASISLTDKERNTAHTSAQSLLSDVFIRTSLTNSTKVRMVETGADTGIFAGSIKVASSGGTTEFSQIQAAEGDTLTISYTDEVNTTGFSRTVTDTASVVAEVPTPTPGVTPTPTPTPTPVETGNIAGQVVDSQTGAGINGATVTLDTGEFTVTGTVQGIDGVYAIQDVSVGQHEITASALNYASSSQTVTVEEGQPNQQTGKNIFNFALVSTVTPTPPETGTLAGRVTDSVTGAGINGATVTADGLTTTTGSFQGQDGVYVFRDVVPGDYAVTASAANYESNSTTATVVAGDQTIANLALTPTTGNLAGQVTDAETGTGIVGATVTADGQTTTTTTGGAYAFQNIEAGDYTVTASAEGYVSSSQSATVVAGETTRVDFALTPGVPTPTPSPTPSPTPVCEPEDLDAEPETLSLQREQSDVVTVTVTGDDDCPAAGVTVEAKVRKGKRRVSVSPASAVTDANGQATFTITATKKTGNAKVRFEADGLRDTVTVKVRR